MLDTKGRRVKQYINVIHEYIGTCLYFTSSQLYGPQLNRISSCVKHNNSVLLAQTMSNRARWRCHIFLWYDDTTWTI